MAYEPSSQRYKDCEKGESPKTENTSSSSSSSSSSAGTQLGMWGLQARDCWLLLVTATVLISLATICGRMSSLHTPSQVHDKSLLGRRSSSSSSGGGGGGSDEGRPAELLKVAAIEAVASAGCSSAHNVTTGTTTEVKLGSRQYLLYFPENYKSTKPAPLVLSYHGGTRTAQSQEALDLLTTTYFNKDYIVVYPNGINETWQGVPGVETDDVGFTAKILDELESQYCVDTNRIFATGKSQGGGFVGVLACDETLSKRIAAYAPVSGAFYISNYGDTCDPTTVSMTCQPNRKNMPILDFHGMSDGTIAYMGGERKGGCLPSIPHWVQAWAERDGLGPTNVSLSVPGALSGSDAVMYEFGSGWQQGLVTHIMDGTNIGHDWPSTEPNSDNQAEGHSPTSFNASSLILGYFATHPLGWSF